jgi:hypothetical protein
MNEYRITKYNPIFRNNIGYYQRDEWTEYSDIERREFFDGILTV